MLNSTVFGPSFRSLTVMTEHVATPWLPGTGTPDMDVPGRKARPKTGNPNPLKPELLITVN